MYFFTINININVSVDLISIFTLGLNGCTNISKHIQQDEKIVQTKKFERSYLKILDIVACLKDKVDYIYKFQTFTWKHGRIRQDLYKK